MSHKRLWLGVATLILAQIALNNVPGFMGGSLLQIALRSVLIALIASFAGGLVARKGIVLPALAVWLSLWAVTAYFLYEIAGPAGQASFGSIIQHNWLAFLGSGAATVAGATLGQTAAAAGARQATAT